MIAACLEKNPASRYASAAEVREALKTIMKALQIETGIIPGEAAANLPTTGAEAEKRATGFLSMLAERFRESANDRAPQNSARCFAFCEPGRDGGGSALRLCVGRCNCGAAGAHSGAGGAAVEHADVDCRSRKWIRFRWASNCWFRLCWRAVLCAPIPGSI